jgi:hypothetical protein
VSATLLAILCHVQLLPSLSQTYDVNGALLYIEPSPTTRYSLKVTYSDVKGVKAQISARWKF